MYTVWFDRFSPMQTVRGLELSISVPLGGRLFKLTAVLTLVGLFFGDYAIYFLLVPALLTAGITIVYSYYLYAQIEPGLDSTSGSNL